MPSPTDAVTPVARLPESVPWLRAAAGLAAIAALYVVYNLIWMAVSAALGAVALGVVALAGIGMVQALPLLGQRWENKLLALRKQEARARPIEQLQNFLVAKTQQVEAFKTAVTGVGAQIKGLEDMVDGRRRAGRDVGKQEAAIAQMKAAHGAMLAKYSAAVAALGQLRETIEDKKFEFAFAQQGQAAMASLNATSGKALLDAMLADEAFASVRDNFNQVFAELETEAARLNSGDKINYDGGLTLNLGAIPRIPQPTEA